jgi:hypothetical protein
MNKYIVFLICILILALFIWGIVAITSKKKKYAQIEKYDEKIGYEDPPSHEDIFGVKDMELRNKISNIMNKFSPVYNFHSDEKYYPAPYDTIIENMNLFKKDGKTNNAISKKLLNLSELLTLGTNEYDSAYKIIDNRLICSRNLKIFMSFVQDPSVTLNDYGTTIDTQKVQVYKDIVRNYSYICGDIHFNWFYDTRN